MNATQPKHATLTEDHFVTEAAGASRWHLVATNQEAPDAVIDVIVDRPVGDQACGQSNVDQPRSKLFSRSRTSGHGA
jgi:hypothetical protein